MKSTYCAFAITIAFVALGSVAAKEKEPSAAAKQGAGMTMMDMMGGGMGGKTQGEDKSPAAGKKDEAGEYEKHHPKR